MRRTSLFLLILFCALVMSMNCQLLATPMRILVLYTHAADIASGGTIASYYAPNSVAILTAISNSSNVPGDQADLVGCFEIDYAEDGYSDSMVVRLTNPSDGFMDEVHFLRYQLQAQIVVVLVASGAAGTVGPYNQNADLAHAFAVVRFDYAVAGGWWTFAHEVGHLMGGQHENGTSPSGSPYGRGAILEYPKNRTPTEYIRTVMCNVQSGQPKVFRWSGPYTDPVFGYMSDPNDYDHTRMNEVWSTKQATVSQWSVPRPSGGVIAIPLCYATIQEGLDNAITGDRVVVSPGYFTITSDIDVPPGVALQLTSGTTLDFAGTYKLRVEGALSAEGTTFTRSYGQWYGIEVYGGSGSISGCTIENAQYGVYGYATNALMVDHSTIQNNSVGIANISSTGRISNNYITGNYYGVSCTDYSQLDFQLNNWVKFNSRGVYIDETSTPQLGTDQNRVYCSIWGNDWDVWSDYGGTINAEWNYWGDYPANPMVYGTVNYSNALMSEPSLYKMASPQAAHVPSTIVEQTSRGPQDTVGMAELDYARALENKSPSTEALSALESVITRYPDRPAALVALAHLTRLVERNGIDATTVLSTYASTNKGSSVSEFAQVLAGQIMIRRGDTEGALRVFEGLALQPGGLFERDALYNAGCLLWYRKGAQAEGEKYFRQLEQKYPKDILSISALATLGESSPGEQLARGKSDLPAAPMVFDLSAAYPNPFNPSTRITFAMPIAGEVSLIVYDVLGREMATLLRGYRDSGYHSVVWDATSHASGIYYVRFTATGENGKMQFSKVNKLLLMK